LEEDGGLDTKANSRWALWAALAMLAAGGLWFLYVLFAASSKPEPSGGLTRFAVGEMARLQVLEDAPPMPSRAINDAEGVETTLPALGGQVLVVNLWATWCAPCMEEMPTLAALQRRYRDRLRVLPISVDSEADLARAQRELARLSGGSLPFYSDISRGVLFDLRAPGMPLTVIYDAEGVEAARLAGGADWGGDDAGALMDAVLGENERGSDP